MISVVVRKTSACLCWRRKA